MDYPIRKKDIEDLSERMEQLQEEQRANAVKILRRIDARASNIISVIFRENSKIREEIGKQTIMFKMLEDNLDSLNFDDGIGVSSKIEVTVGGEVFGTGAKWVWDIDVGKASYEDILRVIQLSSAIPSTVKERAKTKLDKLLGMS